MSEEKTILLWIEVSPSLLLLLLLLVWFLLYVNLSYVGVIMEIEK